MAKKDLTNIIERLDAFEERAQVRLEALAAFLVDMTRTNGCYWVQVYGELHPAGGTSLENDVELELGIYDSSGRLVGGDKKTFLAEDFYGFNIFELNSFDVPTSKLSKLRLVPKRVSYG